jgi:hypothetical protein
MTGRHVELYVEGLTRSSAMLSKYTAIAAFALSLGYLAMPASAAPLASVTGARAGNDTSATEQIAYRRCWWRNGHRHCRWVEEYGYGPGVNLYFRDGGRHHHHR